MRSRQSAPYIRPSLEPNHAGPLISDLQPPELRNITHPVCGTLGKQPGQTEARVLCAQSLHYLRKNVSNGGPMGVLLMSSRNGRGNHPTPPQGSCARTGQQGQPPLGAQAGREGSL